METNHEEDKDDLEEVGKQSINRQEGRHPTFVKCVITKAVFCHLNLINQVQTTSDIDEGRDYYLE